MNTSAASTTPRPAPAARTGSRMALTAVTRGRLVQPLRVLLYGPEGIGKSTFGAAAPSAIFLGAEDGTAQLDIARFPEPKTWAEAFDAIRALTAEEHTYGTLVVDTLDWLEPLCWEHVCREGKQPSIEAFGYGKGYVAALEEWRRFVAALDVLRHRRGMHVILLAHSIVKTFKNPEGEDYDRFGLKVHEKAGGLLKEWVDAVLFTNYETFTQKNGSKVKGISTGARVIHTERRAAWDAKNRFGLETELPLDWSAFYSALQNVPAEPTAAPADAGPSTAGPVDDGTAAKAEAMRAEIRAAVEQLANPAVTEWADDKVPPMGDDLARLRVALNSVKARLGAARKTTTTETTTENTEAAE